MESKESSSGWLWLSALGVFGLFALTSGKPLLALGFLLLGVFAFYNDPLQLDETVPGRRGNLILFSWACGLAGVIAVVSTAFTSWQ